MWQLAAWGRARSATLQVQTKTELRILVLHNPRVGARNSPSQCREPLGATETRRSNEQRPSIVPTGAARGAVQTDCSSS